MKLNYTIGFEQEIQLGTDIDLYLKAIDVDDTGSMYFGLNLIDIAPQGFDDDIIIGKISSNASEITWVHRVYTCDI